MFLYNWYGKGAEYKLMAYLRPKIGLVITDRMHNSNHSPALFNQDLQKFGIFPHPTWQHRASIWHYPFLLSLSLPPPFPITPPHPDIYEKNDVTLSKQIFAVERKERERGCAYLKLKIGASIQDRIKYFKFSEASLLMTPLKIWSTFFYPE